MTTYSKCITLKQTNNNSKRWKMNFKQKREQWKRKFSKLKEAMTSSTRCKKHWWHDSDTSTAICLSQKQLMALKSPRRLQCLILLRKWPRYVEIRWFQIKQLLRQNRYRPRRKPLLKFCWITMQCAQKRKPINSISSSQKP